MQDANRVRQQAEPLVCCIAYHSTMMTMMVFLSLPEFHSVTAQKTVIFVIASVIISNPATCGLLSHVVTITAIL